MVGATARQGRRIALRGTVQGVGFRPFVYRAAREAGLAGRVRNDAAGVTIEAFGSPRALQGFIARLIARPPQGAAIHKLHWDAIPPEDVASFVIEPSAGRAGRRVSIPPDLATCPECLADVADRRDRRYRYPFTNCTHCGPRFTIARDVPYDRAATTMAGFTLCAECRAEYDSPPDRRFHAQPNACPRCGPRLRVLAASGRDCDPGDPLAFAAAALRMGSIVAVKGLGGYHLACDAGDAEAVAELRRRKRRDEKPFAVMTADLESAERLAWLCDADRALLGSPARPIVLVRRREECPIAPGVAPGSPLLGLLLPYTALHHLLLSEAARPLVMTSGNLSDEPLAFADDDALLRLHGIADLLLVHDREIASPCDDSVAQSIGGGPTLIRRARGYVPLPLELRQPLAHAVLACGGELKNTFCLAQGDQANLGPHVGDLEELSTFVRYEAAIERAERFTGVRPELIAHDLHPDYMSTAYARARSEPHKIGVQHHHAHVVSAMAEHGLAGPALGLAYDGAGWGEDGCLWGGELLLARRDGFERLATFRPLRLAGGERAVQQPWRVALALLEDAFPEGAPLEAFALFRGVPAREIAAARRMIAGGWNAPLAHGVGRYFDGFGALALARPCVSYEGQLAVAWNLSADPGERAALAYEIDWGSEPWRIDLRPAVRELAAALLAAQAPAVLSARFHNALVAASVEVVRRALGAHGRLPVVLTGGCFQNRRLAEGLLAALAPFADVRMPRAVPCGDGGLALGQAVVADAIAGRAR